MEFGIYITIFFIMIFFITFGILYKWFHDFYHMNFTMYPCQPLELDMKNYRNMLNKISFIYIANNIIGFLLWGKTPFVYAFFYITTIFEFVVITMYKNLNQINGKILNNKNDIKIYTRKSNRKVNLLFLIFSILFLSVAGYMSYIFIFNLNSPLFNP